jgi:hypothetical protein
MSTQQDPFIAAQLPLLRSLPVPLATIMMQQVIRAGQLFPIEHAELVRTLDALRTPAMQPVIQAFAALHLSPELLRLDWTTDAPGFTERMTTELWATGQINAFRDAAKLLVPPPTSQPTNTPARAVIIVLDPSLKTPSPSLFRKLQPHGTLFHVTGTSEALTPWLNSRATASPSPYAHWHLSGGSLQDASHPIVQLSYDGLSKTRHEILARFNEARNNTSAGGPEGLRQAMLYMTPAQMGLSSMSDPILRAFALDLFTGGSGTQLYATTFVQWSVREALRRAQPTTLVARFTPRSQATSMDTRFTHPDLEPPPDPAGSLVDAEMGAWLSYVNLQRLPNSEHASFLAWHPGYGSAVLIGPNAPAGATSNAPIAIEKLLTLLS